MSIFNNNLLAGAAAQSTTTPVHTIDQSIRFNQAENASMSRTPSSASSRTTWTFSWWWKRGNLSAATIGTNQRQPIFGTTAFSILSNHNSTQIDGINVVYTGATNDVQTSEKFRDVSAWYNFQAVLDTTNDVASERFRLYKNGQRITDFASITYPAKDTEYTVNNTQAHYIGFRNSGENLDGYLAEIVFIDGTALDPSSFGLYNDSNIWIPKDVSGLTFGTNGFHIKGEDSADLGNDSSGNNNDYTASGLTADDQVADSPTNNFAVTNAVNSHPNVALSEGNLKQVNSGTSIAYGSSSTILLTSGKWYVEWRLNTLVSNEYPVVGLYSTNEGRSPLSTASSFPGLLGTFADIGFGANDGNRFEDNTTTSSWANAYANGDIAAMAIDMDNKKIWFGHNNSGSFVWQASGDPAAGSNEANTKAFASDIVVGVAHYGSSSVTFNYGQDGTFGGTETAQGNSDGNGIGNFYYAPPTGFLAICTKNLGS